VVEKISQILVSKELRLLSFIHKKGVGRKFVQIMFICLKKELEMGYSCNLLVLKLELSQN
jgi:hypothetical protein